MQRQFVNDDKWLHMELSRILVILSLSYKNSKQDNSRPRFSKKENQILRLFCTIYTTFITRLSACFIDVSRNERKENKIRREETICNVRCRRVIVFRMMIKMIIMNNMMNRMVVSFSSSSSRTAVT